MSNTGPQRWPTTVSSPNRYVPFNYLSWLVFMALLLALVPGYADEKEDEYLRIYDIVQSADTLNSAGKLSPALAKYREAEGALLTFKRNYPEWNPTSVSYRLHYLATKIAEVSGKIANPPTATGLPQGQQQPKGAANGSSVQEVKLLAPGAEPRKALRLHPKPGDKQVLQMTMKPTMEAKIGEMANPPMKTPGMKVVLELTVNDISAEGDINYQTVFSEATVTETPDANPQMIESIKSAMSSLKGVSGNGTISNRGFDRGTEFKAPADANPMVRQALQQMRETSANLAIPLPEEAIGPGAKWEARTQVKSQGVTLDQTATYQLSSLDGERTSIKSSIAQHAVNQKIQNPAMPGMQADLTKMEGTGTGDLSLLLTQILPSSGTINFHSEVNMSVDMGVQKQPMSMKADVLVTLETK